MRVWLLLAVLGLALSIRLWAAQSLGFDGLYGQDPFAYYYHGQALWQHHTLSYYWPWLPGPLHLFWPIGEPALLAIVFAVAGQASTPLAQSAGILAGLGTVTLTYLLALRAADSILGETAALWAAALAAAMTALAGLQIQASDTIMADAPALFWGMAALYLWTTPAGNVSSSRGRWLPPWLASLSAGCCLALAISTRWEYAGLIPALVLYWGMWRASARHGEDRADGVLYASHGGPVLLLGLAGALLAGWPQLLVSLRHSDTVLGQHWLTGWSPAHLWQATFTTVDGTQRYPVSAGVFYLVRPLLSPQSFPITMAPFVPAGILALAGFWGARRGEARAPGFGWWHSTTAGAASGQLLALLLAWWLAPALYLSGVPYESARFTLIYAPTLGILAAIGLVATLGDSPLRHLLALYSPPRPNRGAAAHRHRWWTGLVPLCGVAWASLSLGILIADARGPLAALARGKTGDLAAVNWLEDHAPRGAHIVTFGLTLMLYHYGHLAAHEWTLTDLSSATPADLRRLAGTGPLVVAANTGNLATQWPGLPPERALAWLQAHTDLRSEATVGGYTMLAR